LEGIGIIDTKQSQLRVDDVEMVPKSIGQQEKLPEVPSSYLKESQEERNANFKV